MKYNRGFAAPTVIAIILGSLIVGGGVYYSVSKFKNKGIENSETCATNKDLCDDTSRYEEGIKKDNEQVADDGLITENITLNASFTAVSTLSYLPELYVAPGYPTITKNLYLGTRDIEVTRLKYIFHTDVSDMTQDYKSTYTEDLSDVIKRFQKENSIPVTGDVDKSTRETVNNLVFWDQYKELGTKLRGTPEWERIKLFPIDITVTRTQCQNTTDKLEAGQNPQCSFAFSIKNNSKNPIALDSIGIKVSDFTDVAKLNGFQVRSDLSKGFYFFTDKIGNRVALLKKYNKENSILASKDSVNLEFSAVSLLQTKMDAQFILDSVSTIFGPVKKTGSYPVSGVVHYSPIFSLSDIGNLKFTLYEGFQKDGHIISFHNRTIKVSEPQLVAIFAMGNYLNESFHITGVKFKVVVDNNIPLDSYVDTFKLGSVTSEDNYAKLAENLSSDTFIIYTSSYVASGVGGVGFNVWVTPPAGIGKIRIDLIGIETEPQVSPMNLPIEGIYQTIIN